jgi:hypothetical protein
MAFYGSFLEPLKLLNIFDFDADPDPDPKNNADPES